MRIHKILAIAGIATFGAAFGSANAAPTGGGAPSASAPTTPALPTAPGGDNPATLNPPGGDDGTGATLKGPNGGTAGANVNQTNNPNGTTTSTAKASGNAGTLDFSGIDKNTDGAITKAEAQASKNPDLAKQFSKLDKNHDGKLDAGEFAQFQASGSLTTPTPPSPPSTTTPKSK